MSLTGAPRRSAANGVLANAADSNPGAPLIVSSVNGSAANVGVGIAGEFGVLTLNADGSYTYYNDNAAGVRSQGGVAMDTFGYTVSDNQGASANSNLTVLVTNRATLHHRPQQQHDRSRQSYRRS